MQLKELLLGLIQSHDEQKAIEKERHESSTVAVDAQANDIKELRATIERQAAELAKLKAPRPMECIEEFTGECVGECIGECLRECLRECLQEYL